VAQLGVLSLATDIPGFVSLTSHTLSTSALLSSVARNAVTDYDSGDQTNLYAKGALVIVNWTLTAGTPSVTPRLQVKDPTSANYTTVWTGTALTSTDLSGLPKQFTYYFYPGALEAAGAATVTKGVNFALPMTWRWRMTHGTVDSVTYSVSGSYLL
jgi:hypothetical protein